MRTRINVPLKHTEIENVILFIIVEDVLLALGQMNTKVIINYDEVHVIETVLDPGHYLITLNCNPLVFTNQERFYAFIDEAKKNGWQMI